MCDVARSTLLTGSVSESFTMFCVQFMFMLTGQGEYHDIALNEAHANQRMETKQCIKST